MRHFWRFLSLVIGVIAVLIGGYRWRRRLYAAALRLGPPRYRVIEQRGLRLPMRDGVKLATDLYQPHGLTSAAPTILIRSPYGRNGHHSPYGILLAFVGRRFAERGYNVVIQDVRGRFGSGGQFVPYFNERNDGLETLAWLREQAWFNGEIGLWGPSYLGIVQWAIADAPEVKALLPTLTSTRLLEVLYPSGVFDLGLALRWLTLFRALDRHEGRPLLSAAPMLWQIERQIAPATRHLPITEADAVALRERRDYFREWLQRTPEQDARFMAGLSEMQPAAVSAPIHLIAGWYDFFLRTQLEDYATLRAAGRRPYLTIGAWSHFSNVMATPDSLREGLAWFDAHLRGESGAVRADPVRVYVMGAAEWRTFPDWPPPAQPYALYLAELGGLAASLPAPSERPDHYPYDPANPTPALGGAYFGLGAGPRDNRRLEARRDVLTYTTSELSGPLTAIGPVRVRLFARSSLPHADFFARLCDVYPDGRSINVCDGLFRAGPETKQTPDGVWEMEIDLWATAYRFAPGHRIRLQISSGAHPRWARNLGTGDPLGTTLQRAEQTVYHDAAHPSALILPLPV
jgi:putative CocE/NonD family hydrolase